MKVFNDARQAADMVAMRMRERDHVKMVQSSRPKIRRNHIFAKIKLTAHRPDTAAAVDQHGLSLRRNHKQGISLAYVDSGNFKLAAFNLRRGTIRGDNRAGKKQSCQSGKSQGAALADAEESHNNSCKRCKHKK